MRFPHRCKCDECRGIETVLLELDLAPAMIATREREIIRAIVE
jgi:hypothetical protein